MNAALTWLRRALGASQEQEIIQPQPPCVTFDDALAHYRLALGSRNLNKKTLGNKECAIRTLKKTLSGKPVDAIRPFEIALIVRNVYEQNKFAASRQVLSVARDIFNEALLQGWVDANPALHVKRLPAPVRRRRLTFDEFMAIYECGKDFAPWFPVAMRLALVTGQRRADIVRLRFSDVHDNHLFVVQQKTGARVAIPVALRLDALGCTVDDVIEEARRYKGGDHDFMVRTAWRPHGFLGAHNLTCRFSEARKLALPPEQGPATPPSFHEIRSLSARLYRKQSIHTQTLLGHAKASMTEIYEDDRGLTRHQWKFVALPQPESAT